MHFLHNNQFGKLVCLYKKYHAADVSLCRLLLEDADKQDKKNYLFLPSILICLWKKMTGLTNKKHSHEKQTEIDIILISFVLTH